MPVRISVGSLLLIGVVLTGCASNYYDTYTAQHPDAMNEWPPPTGAGLHETLAGLYEPPRGRWQRQVSKLDVLKLDGAELVKLNAEQIDAALSGDEQGSYGVVAVQGCRHVGGNRLLRGTRWPLGHAAWVRLQVRIT